MLNALLKGLFFQVTGSKQVTTFIDAIRDFIKKTGLRIIYGVSLSSRALASSVELRRYLTEQRIFNLINEERLLSVVIIRDVWSIVEELAWKN